jgi:hypothetical protein
MRAMQSTILMAGVAMFGAMVSSSDASDFGDRCFQPMTAKGEVAGSMRAAWASASLAWENAVARRHGARYANWQYSGDRGFDCNWNSAGDRIRCMADATPCGRK